jgi:hypothetical protein
MASTGEGVVLTGIMTRRIKKYASEEERNQAKLTSYKKYASKKYYCQTCDKTMSIYNYSDHLNAKAHLNKLSQK